MKNTYFTSESVTRGHPDKVCDQIADRILDAILEQDSNAHVACEVTCATDQVHIFGEITSTASVDYDAIARNLSTANSSKPHCFASRFTSSSSLYRPRVFTLMQNTPSGIRYSYIFWMVGSRYVFSHS